MPLADRLRAGRFAVTLEITPPRQPLPGVLLRRARLIDGCADAVNVIQRPNRQSSLDASLALVAAGIDPVWHLVTRGRTRGEIAADIARAAAGGIRNVLCIRGDHSGGDRRDTPTVREAVAMAREGIPGAVVGATLNQYLDDRARALGNLLPKLRAGADYVQTQPAFDLEALRPFAEAVREAAPGTAIVPMAVPLLSQSALEGIQRRLRFSLPETSPFRRGASDPGMAWAAFDELIATLVASPLVDGVAIMTTEMDPAPETGARIVAALRAAAREE